MENKPDSGNVGIVELDFNFENLNVRPYYYYLFGNSEYKGFGLSADYTYKDLGFFFRAGKNNVDFKSFYSFGWTISSKHWGDLGLGYSFLYNSQSDNNVKAVELYHKYKLSKYISFTTDLQYLKETEKKVVYGFRFYFEY